MKVVDLWINRQIGDEQLPEDCEKFGYMPTGDKNPWGYSTDGMSAEALDKTWEVTIGPLLKEISPDERQGLFAVEDDSWEAGITTWTKQFPTEFQKRRGYDLIPWLPVLAGKNIGGTEAAENDLEIAVVNLWANRLIRDESLPPAKRLTETNLHKFSAATPLFPSGLLGPVEVLRKQTD